MARRAGVTARRVATRPRNSPAVGVHSVEVRPAARPLRALAASDVRARFETALAARDGVTGAHCIHELWMRGEIGANVETSLRRLWSAAATTLPEWLPMRHVDWLPVVYDVAARFTATGRGRSNIYLVLLDYADRRDDRYGIYVGASRYTPAQRFDQHKAGIRASGSVLKRGLEVLTGPTLHLQRIARADAARIEEDLAEALRAAGLLVRGGH
jgi:hypothetical protein